MNRGSENDGIRLWLLLYSFNEAPIHESGKSGVRIAAVESDSRFNEAPIHESGKCHATRSCERSHARFNEAPIHESGK